MDQMQFNAFTPNLEDIESRIIILKRRAAEAEFLREERDMLLNRLKLYSNDYIFPEIQNVEDMKEENRELQQRINELQAYVNNLEQEVSEIKALKRQLEALLEENKSLKEDLAKLMTLEDEVDKLLADKNQLKADFDNAIAVVSSDDPIGKCKEQIKSLYERAQNMRNERDDLREQLFEKEVTIDVLKGKISHLYARLNEKLLTARFKLERGEALSPEEDLILTVHKLETVNKAMGKEIAELTTKLKTALRGGPAGERDSDSCEDVFLLRELEVGDVFTSREVLGLRPGYWAFEGRKSLETESSGFETVEISRDHLPTTKEMAERLEQIRKDKNDIDQYYKKIRNLKSNFSESTNLYQSSASRIFNRLETILFQSSYIG